MKDFLKILCILALPFIGFQSYGQITLQNFESLETAVKKDPRPIVVFVHTDWCMYCKSMKNTTFKNEEIVQKLNNQFYFISLNAETQKTIHFGKRDFKFIPNGHKSGVHQLALELGTINGSIAYPTLTILNSDYEIIFQHASFLNAKQMNRILKKVI